MLQLQPAMRVSVEREGTRGPQGLCALSPPFAFITKAQTNEATTLHGCSEAPLYAAAHAAPAAAVASGADAAVAAVAVKGAGEGHVYETQRKKLRASDSRWLLGITGCRGSTTRGPIDN